MVQRVEVNVVRGYVNRIMDVSARDSDCTRDVLTSIQMQSHCVEPS